MIPNETQTDLILKKALILERFMRQTQGATVERIRKASHSARISDAPTAKIVASTVAPEDPRVLEAQEHASRLELENTTLRSQIEKLERLAFVNSLTGLPNRLALDQHIARAHDHARASGETLAFAIADIDLFKPDKSRSRRLTSTVCAHCPVLAVHSCFQIRRFSLRLLPLSPPTVMKDINSANFVCGLRATVTLMRTTISLSLPGTSVWSSHTKCRK